MYKIGIDARLYSQTGVGVYLRNLLYFLEKITRKEYLYYIYLLPEDYAKIKFTKKYFIKKITRSRWHSFSEQLDFVRLLYKDNLDLVHFTYFSYPVLYRKKFIATIHDTTPFYYKTGKASTKNKILYEIKHMAFKFVISEQVKNSQAIITPSKSIKKHLAEIYGRSYTSKIYPIYEGVDYELIKAAKSHSGLSGIVVRNYDSGVPRQRRGPQNDTAVEKPFFIYVGNFYPHKNVNNLIKAFVQIKTKAKLVLIGPDDYFSRRLLQLINQLKQERRIIFYHNPTTKDLVFFYKNALSLIHPSLSEGFGLPLVEAAYFGLPIIASDLDVFQEILDGKYISFNPKDVDDIAEKIKDFLRKKSVFDYKKILNKFSFERMTKETYKIYQQMLGFKPAGDTR